MKKISSKFTFWAKWGGHIIWYGAALFFAGMWLRTGLTMGIENAPFLFLLVPCATVLFGFLIIKQTKPWPVADEVFDGGDFLLIKNRGEQERVPLSNIMHVSATVVGGGSQNRGHARITILFVKSGKFGSVIAFSPAFSSTADGDFRKVAKDLTDRADTARAQRAV